MEELTTDFLVYPSLPPKESNDATNASINSQKHSKLGGEEKLCSKYFITFKAGNATPKIAPLELISRLETIDAGDIIYSRGMPLVQYRGELMRLVQIDKSSPFLSEGIQEVLVVSNKKKYMGLIVEEILDIVEVPINKEVTDSRDGFIGSIVINSITADIVDLGYFFDEAFKKNILQATKINHYSEKRVLLVDDSPFFRKFIPPELEAAGFIVTTVGNGIDALAKLDDGTKYTAIITDLAMPGLSGQELVNIYRQKSQLQEIPIIALSTDKYEPAFEDRKFTGIDAFVTKTNHGELLKTLTRIIENKWQAA